MEWKCLAAEHYFIYVSFSDFAGDLSFQSCLISRQVANRVTHRLKSIFSLLLQNGRQPVKRRKTTRLHPSILLIISNVFEVVKEKLLRLFI